MNKQLLKKSRRWFIALCLTTGLAWAGSYLTHHYDPVSNVPIEAPKLAGPADSGGNG